MRKDTFFLGSWAGGRGKFFGLCRRKVLFSRAGSAVCTGNFFIFSLKIHILRLKMHILSLRIYVLSLKMNFP